MKLNCHLGVVEGRGEVQQRPRKLSSGHYPREMQKICQQNLVCGKKNNILFKGFVNYKF